MKMKVVMMMVLEYGAPEEGELKKWKPPTLKNQLISKSWTPPHTHTHTQASVAVAGSKVTTHGLKNRWLLSNTNVETVVCCCGTEITFVFPDDAERKPVEKRLPGKGDRVMEGGLTRDLWLKCDLCLQ